MAAQEMRVTVRDDEGNVLATSTDPASTDTLRDGLNAAYSRYLRPAADLAATVLTSVGSPELALTWQQEVGGELLVSPGINVQHYEQHSLVRLPRRFSVVVSPSMYALLTTGTKLQAMVPVGTKAVLVSCR